MIKRLILTATAMLLAIAGAFAEVHIKALDSSNVEITFSYKDDTAAQMNVIGSFDGWTVPGEPMQKNAAGLWEYTLKAKMTDEIQYKFYNNGTWIFDFKAPDKKDDGFGGNNGLIVVADVLASQGAASGSGTAFVIPVRKKIAFGTLSWVESDTTLPIDSSSGGTSSIVAKSLWRYTGDLTPGMPGFIEVQMFDGSQPIVGSGTGISDGLQNLASGMLFDPAYYLGGNKRPLLNQLRFGFETPIVSYENGYGNVYFPVHHSILWDTVRDSSIDTTMPAIYADTGYSTFRLGSGLRQVGDVGIDGALTVDHFTALNGFYNGYAWASAGTDLFKGEVQYEAESNTSTDPTQIFAVLQKQNVVLGLQYFPDQFSIKGQALLSGYSSPAVQALPLTDKLGAEFQVGYSDFFGMWTATFDYKYRGYAAQLLYMDNDYLLGAAATQTLDINGMYKIGHWVTARLDASANLPLAAAAVQETTLSTTPGLGLDFSVPARRPLTADLSAVFDYGLTTSGGSFSLPVAEAHLFVGDLVKDLVKGVDLWYGLDNRSSSALFNSLLAQVQLAGDFGVQVGGGFRTGSAVTDPFGALIGFTWKTPLPAALSPLLYAQLVYAMDPYDSSERTSYAFDMTYPYLPSGGGAQGQGAAAFRAGIKWEF
ncbi:MAG TPA: glycogen-binding domain-containing protein [Rectinemataceae bacterium]|nr:glycogen-binding domain-containing protein [Rectinemataceae bacterium]